MRIINLAILFIFISYPISAEQKDILMYKNPALPIEQRVNDLISRMTLREKVLQLNQGAIGKNTNVNNYGQVMSNIPFEIGSLINNAAEDGGIIRNDFQKRAMEESRLGIPVLFGFDVIHGFKTIFPIPLAQSCSWNTALVEEAAAIAAAESRSSGIEWTFSPMVDVSRDARWGRIAECYGEDSYANARFGVATIRGYQRKGLNHTESVMACLKHFVGYGKSEGGRDYHSTEISDQSMWETYLPPFEAGVKAGAKTIMSAFNDINGTPATANQFLLTDVLKNKWKFNGFVVSDWNAVNQLINQGVAINEKEAAFKAFEAGVEMDMKDMLYERYLETLVKDNKIPISKIDDAVKRILRLKFELGLFERPYTPLTPESTRLLKPASKALSQQLSEESMVLLKNKSLLPLSKIHKRILVTGPMAKNQKHLMGSWSAHGDSTDVTTIFEGLESEVDNNTELLYSPGCNFDGPDEKGITEAVSAAKNTDLIVVCLGEKAEWSGENGSRSTLALPSVQEKLLLELAKTGKKIVLILCSGRPNELVRLEPYSDAILAAWQPGTMAGNAIARIITGKSNPSGRLSVTFPLTTGQIPMYYNMRPSARPPMAGYYKDIPTKPLYEFGHGLSYTTFEYSPIRITIDTICESYRTYAVVEVKNTGELDGSETVFWFISDPAFSISRPIKELKFFEKKFIKAGEKAIFRFEVYPNRDLSYVNNQGKKILESGEFYIMVKDQKIKLVVE